MERVITEDTICFMDNGIEKASFQEKLEGESVLITISGAVSGDITNALLDEMTALIVAGQGITVNLEKTYENHPNAPEYL